MKTHTERTPSVASTCPNAMILAQYASGMLAEGFADEVTTHVEGCDRCQSVVDDMSNRDDSLIHAIRHPVLEAESEDQDLDRLIADAQKIARASAETLPNASSTVATTAKSATPEEPIPIDEFVTCLRRSRLLEDSEVDTLVDEIEPTSSESFARKLLGRNKLTQFQAKALLRGRWKGLVLGNYTVLEKLGEGGMGYVFKARHRRMGNIACIKVLQAAGRKSPEVLERFRREARTIARLNHANIVVAHDADETDGIPFLAMEYIDGSDLSRLVADSGPMSVDEATHVVLQVARALEYSHRQGIVHRDIKPHNLMLPAKSESIWDDETEEKFADSDDSSAGQRRAVKLLDLGLARFDRYLADDPDTMTAASMTATGMIMGTADYMSPEQALNGRNADGRSDIYSLGCTLFYLLTGRVMFDGETLMEKLVAHREDDRPSLFNDLPNIPVALDAIFQKMVERAPEDRYQSMEEVVADLEAFTEGRTPVAMEQLKRPASKLMVMGASQLEKAKTLHERVTPRTASIAAAIVAAGLLWMGSGLLSTGSPTNGEKALASVPEDSADATLRTVPAGGEGRVLVVLPQAQYDELSYMVLDAECRRRGIDLVTTSSTDKPAQPDRELGYPIAPDIQLSEFQAKNFDAVIFCSGSIDEFKHSKSPAGPATRRVIQEALDNNLVVAGINGGWYVVENVMREAERPTQVVKSSRRDGLAVDFSEPYSRQLVRANSVTNVKQLMSFVFDDVLLPGHSETKANGGPGRVLLAISKHAFDTKKLATLTEQLDQQGVRYQTASEVSGHVKNCTNHGQMSIDLRLDEVRVPDFDAIVFCGGGDPLHEFGKGEFQADARRLIIGALDSGRTVAATTNRRGTLEHSIGLEGVTFESIRRGIQLASGGDRNWTLLLVEKPELSDELLSLVIEEL